MPATSQKQQRFMNFTHAVQAGKASGKGYPKVETAAKEMKPGSVEHFMGRGHIDKKLPKKADFDENPVTELYHMAGEEAAHAVKHVKKTFMKLTDKEGEAQQIGFFKAAMAAGIKPLEAALLTKQAFPDLSQIDPRILGAGIGGLGGAGIGALAGGKKHHVGGAIAGGLAGAGLGGLAGAGLGATPNAASAALPGPSTMTAAGLNPESSGLEAAHQSLQGEANPLMSADKNPSAALSTPKLELPTSKPTDYAGMLSNNSLSSSGMPESIASPDFQGATVPPTGIVPPPQTMQGYLQSLQNPNSPDLSKLIAGQEDNYKKLGITNSSPGMVGDSVKQSIAQLSKSQQ